MARVKIVNKARASKTVRSCRICNKIVQVGEPYKSIGKREGRNFYTLYFCYRCEPRPSHQLSGRSSDYARMMEAYEDSVGRDDLDHSGLSEALETLSTEASSMAEELTEGADNIEDGFGHSTTQSEVMRETGDELEGWANDLDSLSDRVLDGAPDDEADPDEDDDSESLEDLLSEANELVGNAPELNVTG